MQKPTALNFELTIPDENTIPVTLPVTSSAVFVSSTKSFHEEGLFSNTIFGIQGSPERSTTYGHIKLKAPIIHPRIYRGLTRAVRRYDSILKGTSYAVWNSKTKDFDKSNVEEGSTGYSFFLKHINELQPEDTGSLTRGTLLKLLNKYKQRTVSYIPVMPAGLRDYLVDKEGKPSKDEINDYYVAIISITNIMDKSPGEEYDTTRYNLQQKVNDITHYLLDETLYGFINKRWINRRVFGGTKNVMTAFIQPAVDLDDPARSTTNHTLVGLFQSVKAMPEHTVFAVQNGFLGNILAENDTLKVINKKTLKLEPQSFDPEFYDLIYGSEAILKLMSTLKYESARSRKLEYNGFWLGIIYENLEDKEVRILRDIDDLPEGKDPKWVRPITIADIFFMSCHKFLHDAPHTGNRHPVMDNGGIYAGLYYLKTTTVVSAVHVIDENGNKTDEIIPSYPHYDSGWYMSVSPNFTRLEPLAGDFDGDTSAG